jgi:hypothetical protein
VTTTSCRCRGARVRHHRRARIRHCQSQWKRRRIVMMTSCQCRGQDLILVNDVHCILVQCILVQIDDVQWILVLISATTNNSLIHRS